VRARRKPRQNLLANRSLLFSYPTLTYILPTPLSSSSRSGVSFETQQLERNIILRRTWAHSHTHTHFLFMINCTETLFSSITARVMFTACHLIECRALFFADRLLLSSLSLSPSQRENEIERFLKRLSRSHCLLILLSLSLSPSMQASE
jgi:hypothetical protein